ncbi:Wzz/FepE/Etk N-terminal domain-containing protein [Bacillus pacificus]|uniref:YveK family protein n=1 Tax=Bacillus pacificus TaxID=2026187 RepID=UPI003D255A08
MGKEIDLKGLFHVVKKQIWILILFTIISIAVGAIYSLYFKTPLYASSTRIMIQANQETMNTLKVMIREPLVLEKVAKELHISKSISTLREQISVESIESSQIVKIVVMDTNPVHASEIANATADVYKQEVSSLLNLNNISILTKSDISGKSAPVNINHRDTITLFCGIGIVLGIGFVLLLDALDGNIRSETAIEELVGAPVFGVISKMNKRNMANHYKGKQHTKLRRDSNCSSQTDGKQQKSKERV